MKSDGLSCRQLSNMPMRDTQLNAFLRSTCKMAQSGPGRLWMTCRRPCAMREHAFGTATPSWCGRSLRSSDFTSSVWRRTFPTNRRRTSPIAMGRTPSSFFFKGIRRPQQRAGAWAAGKSPEAPMATNDPKRDNRDAACAEDFWISSTRCWGRRPDGPGADPLGKDKIADAVRSAQGVASSNPGGSSGRGTGRQDGG